jgi:hypothetical protein
MTTRFRLRTRSSWVYYAIFLVLATVLMVGVWLAAEATTENLGVILASLLLSVLVFTPLTFIATRPAGNWLELQPAQLRVKRWWLSTLDLPYDDIRDVKEGSRHNPLIAWLASKSTIPFEPHVDLVVSMDSVRTFWRFAIEATIGSAIHVSPEEADAFVAAIRRRLPDHQPSVVQGTS